MLMFDELRANLVRNLAFVIVGPMATEAQFCSAYIAADFHLTRCGWHRVEVYV